MSRHSPNNQRLHESAMCGQSLAYHMSRIWWWLAAMLCSVSRGANSISGRDTQTSVTRRITYTQC